MFGREMEKSLFDSVIPSLDVKGGNTPVYCCPAGLKRMVYEFRNYLEQYQVKLKLLKEADDEYLTGVSLFGRGVQKGIKECIYSGNLDGCKHCSSILPARAKTKKYLR